MNIRVHYTNVHPRYWRVFSIVHTDLQTTIIDDQVLKDRWDPYEELVCPVSNSYRGFPIHVSQQITASTEISKGGDEIYDHMILEHTDPVLDWTDMFNSFNTSSLDECSNYKDSNISSPPTSSQGGNLYYNTTAEYDKRIKWVTGTSMAWGSGSGKWL
jgi:hypothetical protein